MTERVVVNCEACNATGRVVRELNVPSAGKYAVADMEVECSACHGEGWVEVDDDDDN